MWYWQVKEKLDDENNSERPLTRDQINRVIVEVNSTINSLKRTEKSTEVSDMSMSMCVYVQYFNGFWY